MIIRYPPVNVIRANRLSTVCLTCLRETATHKTIRSFSRAAPRDTIARTDPRFRAEYFSANAVLEKVRGSAGRAALTLTVSESESTAARAGKMNHAAHSIARISSSLTTSPSPTQDLPHRRRQKARQAAALAAGGTDNGVDLVLPPNSSSTLSTRALAAPSHSLRRLLPTLLSLSKPRLSVLVVLTAAASYSLYPVPELLQPSLTDTPSLSTLTLLFLTTGTSLCAASANALNMLYEPKWDAMMSRTKNRPLVRGLISTRGAMLFAVLSGLTGVAALYYGVNPTVAFLGGMNIFLYAAVYTPMKRISVLNTWVGAAVGGIPPLMGWAAAAGQSATHGDWRELLLGEQNAGAWLLVGLLVAWQLAHFMSLSWSIREEYKNAGYRMLCWVNPARNGRVALRYSLILVPLCVGLCYTGVTEWSFAVLSTPVNLWVVREAWRFWKYEGMKGSARGLFWASVAHLPIVLVLAMVEKKGMWQRVWRAAVAEADPDEDDYFEDDEEEDRLPAESVSPRARATAIALPPS